MEYYKSHKQRQTSMLKSSRVKLFLFLFFFLHVAYSAGRLLHWGLMVCPSPSWRRQLFIVAPLMLGSISYASKFSFFITHVSTAIVRPIKRGFTVSHGCAFQSSSLPRVSMRITGYWFV